MTSVRTSEGASASRQVRSAEGLVQPVGTLELTWIRGEAKVGHSSERQGADMPLTALRSLEPQTPSDSTLAHGAQTIETVASGRYRRGEGGQPTTLQRDVVVVVAFGVLCGPQDDGAGGRKRKQKDRQCSLGQTHTDGTHRPPCLPEHDRDWSRERSQQNTRNKETEEAAAHSTGPRWRRPTRRRSSRGNAG